MSGGADLMKIQPARGRVESGWNDPVDVLRPGQLFFDLDEDYRSEVGRVVDAVDGLIEEGFIDQVVPVAVLVDVLLARGIVKWAAPWVVYLIVDIAECSGRWALVPRPPGHAYPAEFMQSSVVVTRLAPWGRRSMLPDVLDAARELGAADRALLVGSLVDEFAVDAMRSDR